jgi:hypothetical protein
MVIGQSQPECHDISLAATIVGVTRVRINRASFSANL